MTRAEANRIASAIKENLPESERGRLKAIHIMPKLHSGMLTIRLHMYSWDTEEPEAHIFTNEEIHRGDRPEVQR